MAIARARQLPSPGTPGEGEGEGFGERGAPALRALGGRDHRSTWWSESPSPPPSPGVPGEGGWARRALYAIASAAGDRANWVESFRRRTLRSHSADSFTTSDTRISNLRFQI